MSKVICFYTKKEIDKMPASIEEGEALIENILYFELSRSTNPMVPDSALISNLISMIESNTGASRYKVMNKIYGAYENL